MAVSFPSYPPLDSHEDERGRTSEDGRARTDGRLASSEAYAPACSLSSLIPKVKGLSSC